MKLKYYFEQCLSVGTTLPEGGIGLRGKKIKKFRFILKVKVKVSILFIYQEYSGLWAPPGCSVETSSRYPVA